MTNPTPPAYCPTNPFGHQWEALLCPLCGARRTALDAATSLIASHRGWDVESATELLAVLRVELTDGYPSRFSATPLEVETFLSAHLAEDVYLRYQQAIGGQAVEEAAKALRMEAADNRLHQPMSAAIVRENADFIDPMKRGGAGPFPSSLIRFGGTR